MLGYKIATHVTHNMRGVKVLVVLDIPDDVKQTTPEMRYSKIPSVLTANEPNEWSNEAQKYKEHTDEHELFHDFKNLADDLAMDVKYFAKYQCFATYNPSLPSLYIHVRKCRAAKAKVVKIIDLTDGTPYDRAYSDFDRFMIYQTGETVIPDAYTDDYLNICAHGIHYFESPEVATLYHAKDLPPSEASAFLNHAEELLEKLRKGGDI